MKTKTKEQQQQQKNQETMANPLPVSAVENRGLPTFCDISGEATQVQGSRPST